MRWRHRRPFDDQNIDSGTVSLECSARTGSTEADNNDVNLAIPRLNLGERGNGSRHWSSSTALYHDCYVTLVTARALNGPQHAVGPRIAPGPHHQIRLCNRLISSANSPEGSELLLHALGAWPVATSGEHGLSPLDRVDEVHREVGVGALLRVVLADRVACHGIDHEP